jgi:hypothetical protein
LKLAWDPWATSVHGGKVTSIIVEILQDSVFCFQAYVLVPRSIKQKRRGLVAFPKSLAPLLFNFSFSIDTLHNSHVVIFHMDYKIY